MAAKKDFQGKAQTHAQPATSESKDPPIVQAVAVDKPADTKTDKSDDSGWFFAQVQMELNLFHQETKWDDMRRVILLDNQSSENVFSNSELVHSIRHSDKN